MGTSGRADETSGRTDETSGRANGVGRQASEAGRRAGATARRARILRRLRPVALAAVPLSMLACAALGVEATAGLTLVVCVLAVGLLLAAFDASRPAARQLMPTVTLGAVAAAGRILFSAVPDVKPVSAIAIVAGATLGRGSGFVVGALAALLSNAFFGQGAWTPWQMYAWGLVGYLGGVLADAGAFRRQWALYLYGFASCLLYGLILNGWYVVGFVRPLTWEGVLAAYAAGIPLDVVHGLATVAFLAAIWAPWGRAIRRVVVRYGLSTGEARW